jgi:Holliday junction resolvasome RuvABC endonuclease subunit
MILALDPSIKASGWAVLEPIAGNQLARRVVSGTFRPSAANDAGDPFDQLAEFINALVGHHIPSDCVIETPGKFQRFNFVTIQAYLRAVGICEGAVWAASHAASFRRGQIKVARIHRLTVNEWKGNGKKSLTALKVKALFGYTPADDNESDAIGIGMTWICRNPRDSGTQLDPR